MTPFNPDQHHRRSIRLKGYDYAGAGAYFVTLCTHERQRLFGQIQAENMHLNAWGQLIYDAWLQTPVLRPQVGLDAFVVMPDHFHAIVTIGMGNDVVVGCRGVLQAECRGVLQYAPTHTGQPADLTQNQTDTITPDQKGETATGQEGVYQSGIYQSGVYQYAPTTTDEFDNISCVSERSPQFRSPSQTLGAIIRGFKGATTAAINRQRNTPGQPVWQRNYYESIIRNDQSLHRVRNYIQANPANWHKAMAYHQEHQS